jgi:hypothetical protein
MGGNNAFWFVGPSYLEGLTRVNEGEGLIGPSSVSNGDTVQRFDLGSYSLGKSGGMSAQKRDVDFYTRALDGHQMHWGSVANLGAFSRS